jgi:ribosomal protein L28
MVRLSVLAFIAALVGVDALIPSSSFLGSTRAALVPAAPSRESTRGAMMMRTRICDLTGKSANRQAMTVTFSHKRNKRVQGVNLQKKRLWWEEGNKFVTLRISTKVSWLCVYLHFKEFGDPLAPQLITLL